MTEQESKNTSTFNLQYLLNAHIPVYLSSYVSDIKVISGSIPFSLWNFGMKADLNFDINDFAILVKNLNSVGIGVDIEFHCIFINDLKDEFCLQILKILNETDMNYCTIYSTALFELIKNDYPNIKIKSSDRIPITAGTDIEVIRCFRNQWFDVLTDFDIMDSEYSLTDVNSIIHLIMRMEAHPDFISRSQPFLSARYINPTIVPDVKQISLSSLDLESDFDKNCEVVIDNVKMPDGLHTVEFTDNNDIMNIILSLTPVDFRITDSSTWRNKNMSLDIINRLKTKGVGNIKLNMLRNSYLYDIMYLFFDGVEAQQHIYQCMNLMRKEQ